LKPHSLKIELVDASIGLDEVTFLESPEGARSDISMFRKQIKQAQNRTSNSRRPVQGYVLGGMPPPEVSV
jgi:hypothetical protein